jgi:radical SAM protein with 4Fe4S-binding SPASM domain
MSDKLYKKIINEIAKNSPQETIVWYAFMGEPLILREDLFAKIKYAKKKGVKNIFLNTNAIFLDDKIVDLTLASGLDKIIVSIDAFKPETYKKIRCGGDYTLLKKNVLNLLNKKKHLSVAKPEVVVQFIVMDDNRKEEKLFKDYWLGKGATVKIRRKLGWGDCIAETDLVIPQEKRDMPCPWLMRQMVILWNGQVAQCDADYDGIYSAGNVNKNTIYKIWNGELKKRRLKHTANNFDFKPCLSCNDWQVGLSEIHHLKPIK